MPSHNPLTCTRDSGQSAYFVRPSSSISRAEENTCAPTIQYMDVGTPHYAPAPNHSSVVFRTRSDADPASPSRGISINSFFEAGFENLMEAADDTPLASASASPLAAEGVSIELELHVRRLGYILFL